MTRCRGFSINIGMTNCRFLRKIISLRGNILPPKPSKNMPHKTAKYLILGKARMVSEMGVRGSLLPPKLFLPHKQEIPTIMTGFTYVSIFRSLERVDHDLGPQLTKELRSI